METDHTSLSFTAAPSFRKLISRLKTRRLHAGEGVVRPEHLGGAGLTMHRPSSQP
eukprot:COSAG06_NODE_39873_length_407_cov_52.357143_1_plen_54_part_10